MYSDISDLDLDDTKNQLLEDVKKQLPDLDLDKAKAEAPSLEDVEKTLREKCDKNGGEGAYDNVEVGFCFYLWTFIARFLNFKHQRFYQYKCVIERRQMECLNHMVLVLSVCCFLFDGK